MFGPTGIGALYGKADVLEAMPPWQGGGNMIRTSPSSASLYQPPPAPLRSRDRLDRGRGRASARLSRTSSGSGCENIASYEHDLLGYATQALEAVPGLRLIGTAPGKAGVLSFVLDGYRPEDVGIGLNAEGIAVRAGHHCAQPILQRFGLTATVRAALACTTRVRRVDLLAAALHRLARQRAR